MKKFLTIYFCDIPITVILKYKFTKSNYCIYIYSNKNIRSLYKYIYNIFFDICIYNNKSGM